MKLINFLPLAIAAVALNSGSIALGLDLERFRTLEHKLTIALTAAEEVENEDKVTAKTTTSSSTIVRSKISNKDILELFVELGEIEEIKGWSIVGVSYNGKGNFGGNIYLVRGKGEDQQSIDVSEYFDIERDGVSIESYKEVENNETGDFKGSYSEFEAATFDFTADLDEESYIEIDLDAIANQKGTYEGTDEDEYNSTMDTLDFEHGIGEFYDDQEDTSGIVRGSYKFGKGVETEIDDFLK